MLRTNLYSWRDQCRARASEAQENARSVRLELQGDCLAEAINAAGQIGADTLQRTAGRDTFSTAEL